MLCSGPPETPIKLQPCNAPNFIFYHFSSCHASEKETNGLDLMLDLIKINLMRLGAQEITEK